jgi:dTDP-4-dehydrorhamnose reductase
MRSEKALIIVGQRGNLANRLHKVCKYRQVLVSTCADQIADYLRYSQRASIIFTSFPRSIMLGYRREIKVPTEPCELLNSIASLAICYSGKVDSFIYVSSASIYGHSSSPSRESDLPICPNVYGQTKLMHEQYVFSRLSSCLRSVISARVFNMFGAGTDNSIVGRIIRSVKSVEPLLLYNEGKSVRDFIHIDDVVTCLLGLTDAEYSGPVNIGTGFGVSLIVLAEAISLELRIPIKFSISCISDDSPDYSVACTDILFKLLPSFKATGLNRSLRANFAR